MLEIIQETHLIFKQWELLLIEELFFKNFVIRTKLIKNEELKEVKTIKMPFGC
jgi:hypothetical protein